MKDLEKFDKNFQSALDYVKEVISQFARSNSEEEDLLQEFSLEVLSNKSHYASMIHDNKNVYFILKGISKSKYKMNSRDLSIKEEIFYYEPSFVEDNNSDTQEEDISNSNKVTEQQHQLNQIESILYKVIKPNGRKNQVKTYLEQKLIITQYRKSKLSQRKFCKQKGISTATLNKLLTTGPQKRDEPLTIQWFKLYHINGISTNDIAQKFGVTNHTVAQQVYKAKLKINKFLSDQASNI